MKKGTKVVFSGVITAALGVGIFVGNGLLASNVLAKDKDTDKLVITENLASSPEPENVADTGNAIIKNVKEGAVVVPKYSSEPAAADEGETREGIWDEGSPGVNDQTKDQALTIAKEQVIEKYALRPEILNKFTITPTYHEAGTYIAKHLGMGKAVWFVEMQPTDPANYQEIGTYAVYLDAETGQVVKILSAADAVG